MRGDFDIDIPASRTDNARSGNWIGSALKKQFAEKSAAADLQVAMIYDRNPQMNLIFFRHGAIFRPALTFNLSRRLHWKMESYENVSWSESHSAHNSRHA